MASCRLFLRLLPLLFCAASALSAGLRPVQLRCEYEADPIAVDALRPRLSWILESNSRGDRQVGWQIQVASSTEDLQRGRNLQWDSGCVASAEQNQIEYDGRPLHANQECWWRVRVWDAHDRVSAWSAPARWRTALLRPQDWQARWVGAADASLAATNPATAARGLPLLRRGFSIERPLRRAVVHVTGLGQFDLFLDGRKVGDHFLDPAWSVYERTIYYSTFDVTTALRPGAHALGMMLGKGFYNTAGDRRIHGVSAKRPLQMMLQMHLSYADGTEEVLVSDESWKVSDGPITHSAILGGEDYDARRWPEGWLRAGFDDAAWASAVSGPAPGGELRVALSPPLRRQEVFKPVRIDEPKPGVFVYDFGQNASAIPQLKVRGRAGQTFRMTPAEQRFGMQPRRNDGRGLVNPAGVGNPNYFQYTLRGGAAETWSPQFTYSGFQYLQVEGAVPAGHANPGSLPVLEELVSAHVRNAEATVGEFACSEPLYNRIDRNIDWAVRANLSHVLTDCPHREKLGWLEVSYLMGPSIAGRYDFARFYSKIAQDMEDSQRADGQVPTVAPNYPAFGGGFAYTPEWGAAAVVDPWLVHEWTGDRRVLARHFDTMKKFVDYMERTGKDLVPIPGLGDWYDYGHGHPAGESRFTPTELSAMATFQRCAAIVAQAAGRLGKSEEQRHYQVLAENIARAFRARWFDGQAEFRNNGSPQCANAMALTLGLVPEDRTAAVLERVVADVRERGYQQTAGDIGYWYLLQALAQGGRDEVIYRMTTRTNLGSYGFIVNNGWTAMPEAWDADTGASMNHCMLGHVQGWFLGRVAGIRPDPEKPGFAHVLLAPQPVGSLTWARGAYESIRGRITTDWRRDGKRFRLKVALPPNTTATLWLPTQDAASVRESGRRTGPGWQMGPVERGGVRVELSGGRYDFVSACPGLD